MNLGTSTIFKTAGKIYSAIVFVLAFLLLVASCPLKKFLHLNNNSSFNFQNESQTPTSATTNYSASSCCSVKQKTVLVKAPELTQAKTFQIFFTDQVSQKGFAIYNFLSRLDEVQHSSFPVATYSPLPLFLQHRRLLV